MNCRHTKIVPQVLSGRHIQFLTNFLSLSIVDIFGEENHKLLCVHLFPEAAQNISRHCLITLACSTVASPKSNKSSAKNNREIGGPTQLAIIGFQAPPIMVSSIIWLRFSMQSTKKYGDNGSPCLTPRVGVNASIFSPLHNILKDEQFKPFMMISSCWMGRFRSSRVSRMKGHLRRSYAFFKINF